MRAGAFLRAREGATAMLAALMGAALVGAGALATDAGYLYLQSRQLQGMADLAAIAAASDLSNARRAAEATVRANDWGGRVDVEVTLGRYRPDPDVPARRRFEPSGDANAAQVRLTGRAPLFFARVFSPDASMSVSRAATAAQTELAAFEIGSRLLSLSGGVANRLLTALTGSSVNLTVMDYNALLAADVDLFSYVEALRTQADLEAGTFNETLDARVSVGDALSAIAATLEAGGHRAAPAMRSLARAAERTGTIDGLSGLIDLGPYGGQDLALAAESARVQVSALDLAAAILQLANGERQVALDLAAQVPGLAQTRVWLAIGERPNQSPWLAVTNDERVIIRTAQMRLYAEAQVATALAGIARIRVPVLVEAASAQAHLEDISCAPNERDRSVTLAVAPSVGAIALADFDVNDLDNFRRDLTFGPAELVRTPLLTATGFAEIDIGGHQWQRVAFRGDEIARGAVKSVQTRDIAQATVSSLVGRTNLTVRTAGLGLGTGAVTGALRPALAQAAAPLDGLINGLTDLLGVRLGEADVRVTGLRCDGAALVL